MRLALIVAVALSAVRLGFAQGGEQFRLANRHFALSGEGAAVTSLRVDPGGEGAFGENRLLALAWEGIEAGEDTRVVTEPGLVRITDVTAWAPVRIEVQNGGVADKLAPGMTLGQSFTWREGAFDSLEALLPTWHTTTSGGTLRLLRDGPGGEEIAARDIRDAADNAWQALTFPPQEPGVYYVELGEVVGDYGWWSSRERRYADGHGFVDGRGAEGVERTLRVHGNKEVARGEVLFALGGPRLRVAATLAPLEGASLDPRALNMRLRWDNTGYDVSAAAVPFRRFFTDTFRYMPVEQLKRWKERGGRYELQLDSRDWLEAEGTDDHDLRFHGARTGLVWHLQDDEATLAFTPRPQTWEGTWRANLTIEARPREDDLPADWPRFVLPDETAGEEATTFFYERGLSWGAIWGGATWFEWNATARLWHPGPHIESIKHTLATYPVTDEGYVHTWGALAGWPFPDPDTYDTRHFDTNARFILACWRAAAWTRDEAFLLGQAERIRRAMEYQLDVLRGNEGLIVTASEDVTGRHQGVGNNYWDILPFGHLDAYANAVWYASLEAMAQLEEMIAEAEGAETAAAARSPEFHRDLAGRARAAYNETFWDEGKGRYIGCVDIDGNRHDYGFTFVNLESMAYGLASEAQVERIYRWMETEPTSSGEADTYSAWIFAPRATTLHNPPWHPERGKLADVPQEPWWHFGWRGTPYGDQCQDGGAILYTSFYDLMARVRHVGPDNAWQRWAQIIERWRLPDRLCGGPPLYRGEHPQHIHPGATGTDVPFPESSLVPCWLVYGLLGTEATSRGLEFRPSLPAHMPWIEVRNLGYRGLPLTVRADRERVVITCDTPGHEFTWSASLDAKGTAVFTTPPAPADFPG